MGRTGQVRRDADGHVVVRGPDGNKPNTSEQTANAKGKVVTGASAPSRSRWWIHTALGVLEFVPIPIVSGTAGVVDAGFYIQEGNYEDAVWAAASGLPFEKWATLGLRGAKAAKAVEDAKKAERAAKEAEDAKKLKKEGKDGESIKKEKKNEKGDTPCGCSVGSAPIS